jgi:hypothetical protein
MNNSIGESWHGTASVKNELLTPLCVVEMFELVLYSFKTSAVQASTMASRQCARGAREPLRAETMRGRADASAAYRRVSCTCPPRRRRVRRRRHRRRRHRRHHHRRRHHRRRRAGACESVWNLARRRKWKSRLKLATLRT